MLLTFLSVLWIRITLFRIRILDLDPQMLQNDPLRLPSFRFEADPDPSFHLDVDPDPASNAFFNTAYGKIFVKFILPHAKIYLR